MNVENLSLVISMTVILKWVFRNEKYGALGLIDLALPNVLENLKNILEFNKYSESGIYSSFLFWSGESERIIFSYNPNFP